MYDEYCLWAQVVVLLMLGLYCTVWDRYMHVLYLGRAPHTKETLPDFLKWSRVTRHPLVFRGLTGSQQTPGNGASHYILIRKLLCVVFLVFELNRKLGIWSIGIKRKHGIVAIFFFSSPFVFYFDFLLIKLTKTRDCE